MKKEVIFSTLFNLQSMSAASMNNARYMGGGGEDYRALVCIMLGGGNDAYNMLVPTSTSHYNEYQTTRSNLALARNSLLQLNPTAYNEKELGLHPAMTELKGLFDQGKLALINNVGQSANANQDISMNISLSGKNVFQLGQQASEYSILPTGSGSIGINGFEGESTFNQLRTGAVKSLMEKQYQDIFKKSYAGVVDASQNTHKLFSAAVGNTSNLTTAFSETELSQSLQMIARTIKVRKELGAKRQTFFVRFDGWDHHDEVLNNQAQMLGILSKAMSEFQTALGELNVEDCVTTFTTSDFARTLTSNGNGTDHAWGGSVLVMGSKVKGKEIYGSYPSLHLNTDIEVGGGVIIPKISTDEYFAELALWYGVSKGDLVTLFPNIGNFYNTMSSATPLGFMHI